MKNIGAFFDIDGTIYRNSLMDQNFKKLMRHEIIDETIWHREVKGAYKRWKNRRGDYDTYLELLAKVYLENLIGVDIRYLEFLADKTIEDYYDSVYKYSREMLRWHRANDHKIFFVSGSPEFLVRAMAKKYNVTDYIGSKYLVDEDHKLTGEIEKMWNSENKYKAVNKFVEKYNIDMSISFAYGDTGGDFNMLKMVGNPVAINPNRSLMKKIKNDGVLSKKARIVVERKDSIFLLKPDVEMFNLG